MKNKLGHLFNVAVGLSAGWLVFEFAIFHTIGSAIFVYFLLHVAPR